MTGAASMVRWLGRTYPFLMVGALCLLLAIPASAQSAASTPCPNVTGNPNPPPPCVSSFVISPNVVVGSQPVTLEATVTIANFPSAPNSFVPVVLAPGGWGCRPPATPFSGGCSFNGPKGTFYFPLPNGATQSYTANFAAYAAYGGDLGIMQSVTFATQAGPAVMVDPVPDLVQNFSVISATTDANTERLATKGRPVLGVAADGVAQVLLRIPTANPGDQITLTVLDDQGQPSTSPDQYGELGAVGPAVSTSKGPMAFAIYQAPKDYPRPTGQDAGTATRKAFIQVQSADGSKLTTTVNIVRPLLVFIHGLWGDARTWDAFTIVGPGDIGLFHNFRTELVTYDYRIPFISSSIPNYDSFNGIFPVPARGNSLGFGANAAVVMQSLESKIKDFKDNNPAGIPVAAIQADIVAHSMGGDITRTMPLVLNFMLNDNLGQGPVHKVITIDTPHLGSILATKLLDDRNACVRDLMARFGSYSFEQVTFSLASGGEHVSGAIGDLAPSSHLLLAMANDNSHPLKIALIAGTEDAGNLAGFNNSFVANLVRCKCNGDINVDETCGFYTSRAPLAASFTAANWPGVFGEASDGIVGITSMLNGLDSSAGSVFTGRVHGKGATALGLNPPTMTDRAVAPKVLDLLNTPISDSVFNQMNP